jgi:hypothetical protein
MFYIFPNAVPKDVCKQYLDYCLKNAQFQDAGTVKEGMPAVLNDTEICELTEKGTINGETPPVNIDHVMRKTDISFINDENNLMNELCWGFIREANTRCFKYKLDHFQPIQFAKYQDGGHYEWHQDDILIDVNGGKEVRKLSLTFSLTDDSEYDGGLLEFFNGSKEMIKKGRNISKDIKSVGTAIVFDSSDWHRVTPVTRGIRYSLVCWTIGPRFE